MKALLHNELHQQPQKEKINEETVRLSMTWVNGFSVKVTEGRVCGAGVMRGVSRGAREGQIGELAFTFQTIV